MRTCFFHLEQSLEKPKEHKSDFLNLGSTNNLIFHNLNFFIDHTAQKCPYKGKYGPEKSLYLDILGALTVLVPSPSNDSSLFNPIFKIFFY